MYGIEYKRKKNRIGTIQYICQWSGLGVVACFTLIVVMLNTNQVFADSMCKLPGVGGIAQVLTFVEYTEKEDFGTVSGTLM